MGSLPERKTSHIVLIPWDPESKEHCERLHFQRIACGWGAEDVGKWQAKQNEGKMNLHWIVLAESYPRREAQLQKHISTYPHESLPLTDTAASLFGKPRAPTSPPLSFIPVGHISIDSESDEPELADPSKGICRVTTGYVSRAIQGTGIGSAAVDIVEVMATKEPLCAKVLTVDTVSKEAHDNPALWAAYEIDPPKASLEETYKRHGYTAFKYVNQKYTYKTPKGEVWKTDAVFMRKTIA